MPAQIVHAIEEVARGGSVIDPLVVEALVAKRTARASSALERLTPREREVLEQMAQGRNNAGIAQALFLSRAGGRETHQLVVLEARAERGARRAPPGEGRAALPLGTRR